MIVTSNFGSVCWDAFCHRVTPSNRHRLLSPITRYEFQMQYGSIGWSVGATLGYAQAAKDKRVIACIGDGSFQV